jgi:tetratricopeptide (TPR) repeat protein
LSTRRDARQAMETLHDIESVFDRTATWIATHPATVLSVLGTILLVAAAIGLSQAWSKRVATQAATAVAEVQSAYLRAMGAAPGSIEVVEPANPETARVVRMEYVEKFLEVGEEHAGTAAAVTALLEAGQLLEQVGDLEAALDAWQRARDQAPRRSALRAVALVRLARGYESAERWAEAAEAHAEAGAIEKFPARAFALADAARGYARAGDHAQALELFAEAERAAGDEPLPPHIAAPLRELRAATATR